MIITWLIVAVATAAGVGLYIPAARRYGWVAQVTARSSHQRATAVGAGIMMALVLLPVLGWLVFQQVLAAYWLWFVIGAAVLSMLGWLDDRVAQSVRLRLLVQFLVLSAWAGVAIHAGPDFLLEGSGIWLAVGLLVLLLAQAWFVNLFNFMDGLDGFAAIEALCVFAGLYWLQWPAGELGVVYAAGGAAVAGLLVWNLPPAKVFMGDAGSLLLGFWLSAPLWLADWQGLGVWLILTAAFNVDASLTLLARYCRGEVLSSAHRSHLYQRLARHWGSHVPVLLALLAVNVVWLLPWAWWASLQPGRVLAGVMAAYGGLVLAWWCLRGLGRP